MKKMIYSLLCTTALLFADDANNNSVVPPYDADLFRKEEQVFSGHVSFLYWRVEQGALDYALKMQHAPVPGISYAQGDYERATFDGEPGFRVALGFFRALKYWELWAQYTRLTARGEDDSFAPQDPSRFLVGTWPELTSGPLTRAKSRIHLNYNVGDFLVDRFVNPNPHLRARFLGGATVAWINQNWIVSYYERDLATTQIGNTWKFIGAGIRAGSSFDWFCGYDIYMTGQVTLASLLGSYHNTATQTTTLYFDQPIRDAHYFDIRPVFQTQVMFGLSWQKNFCSNRVEVFTGYELNTWFNLAEVRRSTSGQATASKETLINSSLIALQGLTARLSVDF